MLPAPIAAAGSRILSVAAADPRIFVVLVIIDLLGDALSTAGRLQVRCQRRRARESTFCSDNRDGASARRLVGLGGRGGIQRARVAALIGRVLRRRVRGGAAGLLAVGGAPIARRVAPR